MKSWISILTSNWERLIFSTMGLVFLIYSINLLNKGSVIDSAIIFGVGFLSFIYANVSRFKKFKGFGFEAELWEDKQKEAVKLIDRLKEIVSIYTREILLGKVKAGRFDSGNRWKYCWQLYDNMIGEHQKLGQSIDFSDIKKSMDDYFLFDLSLAPINKLRQVVLDGKSQAKKKIDQEFGSPIRDQEGYAKRLEQYRAIQDNIENPFEISKVDDLARYALDIWKEAKERLKRDFDIEIAIDESVVERLEKISSYYQNRPVEISDEILSWADEDR